VPKMNLLCITDSPGLELFARALRPETMCLQDFATHVSE
jgi:hypothetical protein